MAQDPPIICTERLQVRPGPPGRLEVERQDGRPTGLVVGGAAVLLATGDLVTLLPTTTAVEEGEIVTTHVGDDVRVVVRVAADPVTNDVLVRADAVDASHDLAGVLVHLSISDDLELHLPAVSGLRLARDHDLMPEMDLEWPRLWNAAMLVAQGPAGGVSVHTEDPEDRPKGLYFRRGDGVVDLMLRTEEQAPFAGRRSVRGHDWRIAAHDGAGMDAPIARYQDWLLRHRGRSRPTPPWVDDVRLFVSFASLDTELMDALAARIDPRTVMLHVSDWRALPYDRGYPDYRGRPDLDALLAAARRHGYRVIPHSNVFAADRAAPTYEQFADHHIRDRFTGEPQSWHWEVPGHPDFDLAYIHPASPAWRRSYVGAVEAAVRSHGFDGLFTDQTFHAYNHAGGLVEGRTVVQGMGDLLEELHERLGPTVLAGEGVNEVAAPHQAFSQLALWGFGWGQGWYLDEGAVPRLMSDLLRRLFEPWTRSVVYWPVAGPNALGGEATMASCYERIRPFPSLSHVTAASLADPTPLLDELIAAAT